MAPKAPEGPPFAYDPCRLGIVEPTDLDEVELTDQEKNDLIEAWLSYLHSLPPDAEPDVPDLVHSTLFKTILNRILAAHDFEPFSATFRWGADDELVVLARPLPKTRATD